MLIEKYLNNIESINAVYLLFSTYNNCGLARSTNIRSLKPENLVRFEYLRDNFEFETFFYKNSIFT